MHDGDGIANERTLTQRVLNAPNCALAAALLFSGAVQLISSYIWLQSSFGFIDL